MQFGSKPIDSTELATLLLSKVKARAHELQSPGSNRAWTKAVFEVLGGAGRTRGYEVYCHGAPGGCEWLLDFMWWERTEQTMGIKLACESEWYESPDEVSWDFHKLLCVKAPLKLLIYAGGPNRQCGKGIRQQLERDLALFQFHVAGEEYLFVSLDEKGGYADRVVIPWDGPAQNILWEPIGVHGVAASAGT